MKNNSQVQKVDKGIIGFFVLFSLFIFFFSFNQAYAALLSRAPNNLDLVGYWSLNEGVGTQAGDSSGQNKNGTLTNSPTWVDGKRGKALTFGSTSYVNVSQITSLDSGDMSLCLWVKPSALPSGGQWLLQQWNTATGPALFTESANITWQIGDYANRLTTSSNPVTIGIWQYICGTASGTNLSIYYNGQSVISGSRTRAEGNGSGVFGIAGPNALGTLASLSGSADDVRIYNRALSAGEVKQLYLMGK